MLMPASIDELQRMVDDRVQESIHLDYKASQACDPNRPTEIAKDISSFANSDGGVVIYGVEEEKDTGFPLRVDGGVDPKVPKERLENIITDHVTPRVDCEIIPLPLAGGRAVFVVRIGKSFSGPHQASDKKYYKRHNFKSAPMEDYEINDVRSRPKRVPPLVTFEAASYARSLAVFDIANVGEVAAEDVRFTFSEVLPWPEEMPYAFKNGIHRMPPRQKFRFRYYEFTKLLAEGSTIPASFSVTVSYVHPDLGTRQSFVWYVNLNAYRDSLSVRSDEEHRAQQMLTEFKDLNNRVERLCRAVESFQNLAGSTGLDLTVWTVRNLGRVLRDGKDVEPLPVEAYRDELFREVLGVDWGMANRIAVVFNRDLDAAIEKLKLVEGMTPELMERIQRCFAFTPKATDQPQGAPGA